MKGRRHDRLGRSFLWLPLCWPQGGLLLFYRGLQLLQSASSQSPSHCPLIIALTLATQPGGASSIHTASLVVSLFFTRMPTLPILLNNVKLLSVDQK